MDQGVVERLAGLVGLKTWATFLRVACSGAKVIYIAGGWRAGKSALTAFIAFIKIVLVWLHRENPDHMPTWLVWIVGPDYEQARPEYRYLVQWFTRLPDFALEASTAQQGSLRAIVRCKGLPGTVEIVTKSASDPTSLGGVAPVLIIMAEAAQQPEEIDMWVDGRTAEMNADVIKSGTFENEEHKEQYAWFELAVKQAMTGTGERVAAFSLPTWENQELYGDCRKMLAQDPGLAAWCPPGEHGPGHAGLLHPMIRQLKERWRERPLAWRKRFGGEAVGIDSPVYEWAALDSVEELDGNRWLISLSEYERQHGARRWGFTAGGLDPGLVHPAGIAVCSVDQQGDVWCRDARRLVAGNNAELYATKDVFQRLYRPAVWGGDPVGLKYTRPTEQVQAMTGSLWAREERAAIVNSYAVGTDGAHHLYFDADVPGVRLLFEEYQGIHRKRRPDGQMAYNRVNDDMVAAHEDAVAAIYSRRFSVPRYWSLGPRRAAGPPALSRGVS